MGLKSIYYLFSIILLIASLLFGGVFFIGVINDLFVPLSEVKGEVSEITLENDSLIIDYRRREIYRITKKKSVVLSRKDVLMGQIGFYLMFFVISFSTGTLFVLIIRVIKKI